MRLDNPSSLPATEQVSPDEPGIRPAMDDRQRAQAEAAAEKFEGYFITEMLRQMRRSARAFAEADGSAAHRTNEDMLDFAYVQLGEVLASQRAFGIADLILRQLLPTVPATAAGGAEVSRDNTRRPNEI